MTAIEASSFGAWFGTISFIIGLLMVGVNDDPNSNEINLMGNSLVSYGTWLMIAGIAAAVANTWILAKYQQPVKSGQGNDKLQIEANKND